MMRCQATARHRVDDRGLMSGEIVQAGTFRLALYAMDVIAIVVIYNVLRELV